MYLIMNIAEGDFNPHSRTGSDLGDLGNLLLRPNFNPHSRTGSDVRDNRREFRDFISIHTPARGVTIVTVLVFIILGYFNPHSRTGSDPGDIKNILDGAIISIHTPARGVT